MTHLGIFQILDLATLIIYQRLYKVYIIDQRLSTIVFQNVAW